MPNDRRVVVTGLGVISSLGIGWEEWWKNIMAGKSGISRITAFDVSDYDIKYAGEIKNFRFKTYISKEESTHLGRGTQIALAACRLALKDSRILASNVPNLNMAISLGTTMGEAQVIEQIVKHSIKKTGMEVKERRALAYPANSIPLNVGRILRIRNKNLIFANACAAGNYALGYAYDLIRNRSADYVLTGGVDALSRIAFTGFNRLFAMAPEKCQPFDKNRKGMMLGEGGALLVLESLENAVKRKAPIYGEVLGYGLSCDANHMTHPDFNGVQKAIQKAIDAAGIHPEEVSYVSAHGTGTFENDKAECHAYQRIFKNNIKNVPISSIKSMLAHTMGAASAFESIASVLALKTSKIPPTINYESRDTECDIDCVPNVGRDFACNIVLNNAQAFGGNNACVAFSSIDGNI